MKNNFTKRAIHKSKTNPNLATAPPPVKVQPIDKCRSHLLDKLRSLKENYILRYSLIPNDSTFEVLEFYGDSVLYERISYFLMQTRRFMSPHLLTQIRCAIVQNKNLATAFDTLGLAALLPEHANSLPLKGKADVVEAIIGELSESIHNSNSTVDSAMIRGVLDELLAYISYTGEQEYFRSLPKEEPKIPVAAAAVPQTQPATPAKTYTTSVVKTSDAPKKILKRETSPSSLVYKEPASKSKALRPETSTNESKPKEIPSSNLTQTENVYVKSVDPRPPVLASLPSVALPQQQPKLLLYRNTSVGNDANGFTMPNSSPYMTATSPALPFPKALVYEMPPFTSTVSSPAEPMQQSPPRSPYSADFYFAKAQLGGRSITEYNTSVM